MAFYEDCHRLDSLKVTAETELESRRRKASGCAMIRGKRQALSRRCELGP